MGHSFRKEEQHLLEMAADFLTRMTELEKLRVAVDLAEAAQALQLEELQRRPDCSTKAPSPMSRPQGQSSFSGKRR